MSKPHTLHVAVEGCAHGDLDNIYASVRHIQDTVGVRLDLLICCGDFQAVRNEEDLECLACPPKYRAMQDFYKYYTGEAVAPVLTIFVGGNHEASNHLRELHYGGWVAPNIYYLGTSAVVRFGGLRIAGVSGIFKPYDFRKPYFERPPFDHGTIKSVFHARQYDYERLAQVTGRVDVMVSHDWPAGIAHYGNMDALFRAKPFLRSEVMDGSLGSPPSGRLLAAMRPAFWFAAHLHVKFAAMVPHGQPPPPPPPVPAAALAPPIGATDGDIDIDDVLCDCGTGVGGDGSTAAPRAATVGADDGEIDIDDVLGVVPTPAAAPPPPPAALPTPSHTRFLSLSKCLPRSDFLQVVHIPAVEGAPGAGVARLAYDPEWLAIVSRTHPAMNRGDVPMPAGPPTPAELQAVNARLALCCERIVAPTGEDTGLFAVPNSFARSARAYDPAAPVRVDPAAIRQRGNPQTDKFLNMLGLPHVVTVPCAGPGPQ